MELELFTDRLENEIRRILDEQVPGSSVEKKYVEKIQGAGYMSITVALPGDHIAINLNPADLYGTFRNRNIHETAMNCLHIIIERLEQISGFDTDWISDYEKIRKKLVLQLIPQEGNEKMLQEIPHRKLADLALICRIMVRDNENGFESCIVNNTLLESYDITVEQLFEDAFESAEELCPPIVENLEDMIMDTASGTFSEDLADEFSEEIARSGLMFVGAENGMFGAAALFYPGVMEDCEDIMCGSFYILPSSIHELLITDVFSVDDPQKLNDMIREINRSIVEPKDRLSDHAYYYDALTKQFMSV